MKYYFILVITFFFNASSLVAFYESEDILIKVHSFLNNNKHNLVYKINEKKKIPTCFGNIDIKKKI